MQTLVWNRSWRLCEDISHSLVQNSWWIMAENDWTLFGIFEIRDTLSMWKSMDLTKALRNSSQHICWMSGRFKRSESDKLQVPIVVALANITLWRFFPRLLLWEPINIWWRRVYAYGGYGTFKARLQIFFGKWVLKERFYSQWQSSVL